MELFIALLVTVLVALVAYELKPLPAGFSEDRMDAAYRQEPEPALPFHRGLLAGFGPLVKYTPAGWLKAIGQQLYWCQLGGRWAGWSLTEVAALHLALIAAGGIGGLLVTGQPGMALAYAGAGPLLLNMVLLRAPARRVRRQLAAELPEFIAILAAEAASQTSLHEGLNRLSRGPGTAAAWFRRVLQNAVGHSLFTEGGEAGALFTEARLSGDRELISLARALDNIKRRGTGTRELLAQMARDTAARFTGEAALRAEKVGSEIILPMIAFFFLPYIVVILSVLAGPLLSGGLF